MSTVFGYDNTGFQAHTIHGSVRNEFNQIVRLERPETIVRAWTVPFSRDSAYVQDNDLLDRVRKACDSPERRAALVGIGGVGYSDVTFFPPANQLTLTSKSQVAIEQCFRQRDLQENSFIFWIYAESTITVREGFQRAADVLNLGKHEDSSRAPWLVKSWLERNSHVRWIIVVDNADDEKVMFERSSNDQKTTAADDFTSGRCALAEYLPTTPNGFLIITTRDRRVARRLCGNREAIIDMGPMSKTLALQLARKKLGVPVDEPLLLDLLEELDFVPLALTQAFAFIEESDSGIKNYLEKLRKHESSRLKLLSRQIPDMRRSLQGYSNSAIRTWHVSFQYILQERPSASALLSLLSLFSGHAIPEYLLRPKDHHQEKPGSSSDEADDFGDDVAVLRRFSLVKASIIYPTKESSLSVHRLVQLSTRAWLTEEDFERIRIEAIGRIKVCMPKIWFTNLNRLHQLIPHVTELQRFTPRGPNLDVQLDNLSSWVLDFAGLIFEAGLWTEACSLLEVQHQSLDTLPGLKPQTAKRSLTLLGLTLHKLGRYTEAEQIHLARLDVMKESSEIDSESMLTIKHDLASVYIDQGRYKEADRLLDEVMLGRMRIYQWPHLSTATTIQNRAVLKSYMGCHRESLQLHRQALAARETLLEQTHPDTIRTAVDVAWQLHELGDLAGAKVLLEDCGKCQRDTLGQDHPDVLNTRGKLGAVLSSLGQYQEAVEVAQSVYDVRKRILGPSHPDTLTSMGNLASYYQDLGRCEDSELMSKTRLRLSVETEGAISRATETALNNLALVLKSQGKLVEACKSYMESIEVGRKLYGDKHPNVATTKDNLANVLSDQGKYNEARGLCEEALQDRQELLGAEHPKTLIGMNNLASIIYRQGKWEEARILEVSLLEIRIRVLGKHHSDTLATKQNLAVSLSALGVYDQARDLQQDALKVQENLLGLDHPDTLRWKGNLASTLDALGQMEEAKGLKEDVFARSKRLLGETHPLTLIAMGNYAELLQRQGMLTQAQDIQERALEIHIGNGNGVDTFIAEHNLAFTLWKRGKLEEALLRMKAVVTRSTLSLGPGHHSVLSSCDALSGFHEELGQQQEAIKLLELILSERQKVYDSNHSLVNTAKAKLGRLLSSVGRLGEAANLENEVLETWKQQKGAEDPMTIAAMNNLAVTQDRQGRSDTAEALYQECYKLKRRVEGEVSDSTLLTARNLVRFYEQRDRNEEALGVLNDLAKQLNSCYGPEHIEVLLTQSKVAKLQHRSGIQDEAVALLVEVTEKLTVVCGANDAKTVEQVDLLKTWLDSEVR